MRKPKISVVIPAFNEEEYLPLCLSSLEKQILPPFEVIVVDNNSSDKTAKIAKKFGAKVVKEKNQGMAFARDRGFDEAKGEIIARTDADSVPPSDWLLKLVKIFQKDPTIMGVAGTTAFHDLSPALNLFSQSWFTGWMYISRILSGHHQFNGPNYALKKDIWRRISPCSNNLSLHEDMDLACHVAKVGKIFFDPSLVVLSSARRFMTKPLESTFKYTLMTIYTLFAHGHPLTRNHKS